MTRQEAIERLNRIHQLISAVHIRISHLNDLLEGYQQERIQLLDIIREANKKSSET